VYKAGKLCCLSLSLTQAVSNSLATPSAAAGHLVSAPDPPKQFPKEVSKQISEKKRKKGAHFKKRKKAPLLTQLED
jgi:hypothetical protein